MTVATASAGKFTARSWLLSRVSCLTESIRARGTNFGSVMTIKIPEPCDNKMPNPALSCRNLVAERLVMDIKIGIKNSARELSFDSSATAKELEAKVSSALDSEAKLISLTDSKGNVFLIPTKSITYLEIGAEETRRVGFIA